MSNLQFAPKHSQPTTTARRVQADALEIEAQAKRQLADEYDGAQERGETAKNGQRAVPGAEQVGFTRKEIH